MNICLKTKTGVTLLECILALAIAALLLSSLVTAYAVSRKSWVAVRRQTTLVEQGRLAMNRIAQELRYADKLTTCSSAPAILEFQTRDLLNDDYNVENIKYRTMDPDTAILYRSENGGKSEPFAGAYADSIQVSEFIPTALKNVSGTLTPLTGLDTLDMAVAVRVQLQLSAYEGVDMGNSFQKTFTTEVGLRNAKP